MRIEICWESILGSAYFLEITKLDVARLLLASFLGRSRKMCNNYTSSSLFLRQCAVITKFNTPLMWDPETHEHVLA